VGCGDDDGSSAQPLPTDLAEVEAIFADDLAEQGLRLSDRGGLVDPEGGYSASATGDHLSLYVTPIDARTTDEYVEGILVTARLLGPGAFERWPGLQSFDVCQEPTSGSGEDPNEAALTRLDMDRDRSDSLDWDALDLPGLLAIASEQAGEGVALYVEPTVRESPEFVAALEAAGLSP
jgi:hypothetical protein